MFFDPISLPALLILASTAGCPDQGRVEVDVRMEQHNSPFVTNINSRDLTAKYGHDPDSTLSTDGNWMIGGVTVTSGDGFSAHAGMGFTTQTNYSNNTTCFTVSKLEYVIDYSPIVYIAEDFKNMGCRYSQVMMHEKRHVQTDVRTITDFIPEMRKQIEKIAEGLQPQGPYPNGGVEQQEHRVLKEVTETLTPVWTQLVELRRKRQAEIDTEANYLRDTAVCPGQFPKFDGTQ